MEQNTNSHLAALEREIAELIVTSTGLDEEVAPEEIDATAPLFGDGGLGLDSIDALEIGVAINKRYGVALSADSEETRRHFVNLRALASFVSSQRG